MNYITLGKVCFVNFIDILFTLQIENYEFDGKQVN